MNESKAIGKRLQAVRKYAGFSQQELAAKSGVSFRSIQDIEGGSGNPTIQTILALSKTLKKDLIIFDVEDVVDKKESEKNYLALLKDHQFISDELAKFTKMNFSLQDKYIEVLERLKDMTTGPMREAVSILTTLDDSQLYRAIVTLRALRNASTTKNASIKHKKHTG